MGRFLPLLLACLALTTRSQQRSLGPNYGEYTVTGFFGCRFSSVCTDGEVCIDDGLFGNCQNVQTKSSVDSYQYDLSPDTIQLLIGQLENLVSQGYAWDNLYTQCVVGNLLLASRVNNEPDLTFCDPEDVKENAVEGIDPAVLAQLRAFVDENDKDKEDSFKRSKMASDRDFVKVHKYFKERDANEGEKEIRNYLASLDTEDLVQIKDYLKDMRNMLVNEELQEALSGNEPVDVESWPEPGQTPDWLQENPEGDNSEGRVVPVEPVEPVEPVSNDAATQPQTADDKTTEEVKKSTSPEEETISPDEAKLLFDLVDGKELPEDLSDDEINRLTEQVADILDKIRDQQKLEDSSSRSEEKGESDGRIVSDQMAPGQGQSDGTALYSEVDHALTKKRTESEPLRMEKHVAEAKPGYSVVEGDDALNSHAQVLVDEFVTIAPTPQAGHPASVVTDARYRYVDDRYVFIEANRKFVSEEEALRLLGNLQYKLHLPPGSFSDARIHDSTIVFRVNNNAARLNASDVAHLVNEEKDRGDLINGLKVVNVGTRDWDQLKLAVSGGSQPRYFVLTFVVCGCVAGILLAVLAIYLIRRHTQTKQKLGQLAKADPVEASKDYQDLCRQRMQSKASEKPEPLHAGGRVSSVASDGNNVNSPSSRSSTSSWSEEPITTNMDITTGHIILSYMEDHLKNKDRLDQEWEDLSNYIPEPNATEIGANPQNARKNRYTDILPYDHSRVVLNSVCNVLGSDYVNANTITDHDPRNPAYIATQGPLPHTVADFWQMVWEQGSAVIVMLTKLSETGGTAMCHRYWPEEGSDLYHIYEVHLVSEHIWCDDYLVRSFYLKNLQTNETRTVTQFHFLTWQDLAVPSSAKALLDFRRKVNKSYKGRSCPIVVHCNDGVGRTGMYCLMDMVLSRMSKGTKEIDIAATLEHIRDQRMAMVKTKQQFEFVLTCVAEEVHAILKALPQ